MIIQAMPVLDVKTVLVVNGKVLAVGHCRAAAWGNARATQSPHCGAQGYPAARRKKERKGEKQQREHQGQRSRRCFVVEESCFHGVLQLIEGKQGEGKWCLINP